MRLIKNRQIGKIIFICLLAGIATIATASDMFSLVSVPGKSLSFNVPVTGKMNDVNDYFSFVKSRSSIFDNKNGYGIINYSHDRCSINIENMWYLNDSATYYNNGKSIWQESFDSATEKLILGFTDKNSSIVMAAANNQARTLKSHPARFDYNGKTYSLILNGSSGSYPGPTVNRSYEYSFFRDAELTDEEGAYNWFKKYPSVWSDVDPYTADTNFTFKDFPTGEITLNVIMYYLITENISLDSALYRALTDTHFGNGFEHTYEDSTYTSLDLKAHITDTNYAFTAIVSDGEKVYAFKSWKENDANINYCQDFQIGYIQNDDFTAITSIGERGNYSSFKDVGLKLLGQFDLAILDPNKRFDPSTDIKHNFLNVLPEGTIGEISEPAYSVPLEIEDPEITIDNVSNTLLSKHKDVSASTSYGVNYGANNLVDTSENTVWASGAELRNQWAYIKLGSGNQKYTVNEIKVKWAGKYFAKKFRLYGHKGGNIGNIGTWDTLTWDAVTNYNTIDGVYTLSNLGREYQYIGIWLYDLNDVCFAIKEIEVYGHKSIVDFPDENLRKKILSAVGKTTLPIFKEEVLNLKSLNVDGVNINKWEGIRECKNLEKLSAKFCGLESFPDLSSMEKLNVVDVSFNKLTSVSKFNSASELEKLAIRRNEIRDIKPNELSNLTKLKILDISENELQSVSGIYYGVEGAVDLNSLEFINVSGNTLLNDIDVLNSLSSLKTIIGAKCQIVNAPQFNNLLTLENLDLSGNLMSKAPNLTNNLNLIYLNLNDNVIDTLDNVVEQSNTKLKYVYLDNNKISALTHFSTVPNLNFISLRGNKISDITPLEDKLSIRFLDIEMNNMNVEPPLGSDNLRAIQSLKDALVYYKIQKLN